MSVEHTSQLLQLILNSVMMMVCCGFVLGRLSLRCATLDEQIHSVRRASLESDQIRRDRGLSSKRQLHQLQRCRRVLFYGSLATHYALLLAVGSSLLLATRTLLHLEFLIPLSLGLFTAAAVALTAGVGGGLLELHMSQRALWHELETLTELDAPVDLIKLRAIASNRSRGKSTSRARSSQARVG